MKKLLINISLVGALGLIAPSIVNNVVGLIHELKSVTKLIFDDVKVPGKTSFYGSEIAPDPRGFYWMSSDDGLWKSTDGVNFTQLSSSSGLSTTTSDYIKLIDSTNTVWVAGTGTGGWNLYYSKDGNTFQKATLNGSTGAALSRVNVFEDSKSNLWVSCSDGLFKSTNHETFDKITSGLPTSFSPFKMCQTPNGVIYIVDTLHVYSSSDGVTFKQDTGTGLPATMGSLDGKDFSNQKLWPEFYQDSFGNLFIKTNYQIYKCNTINPQSFDSATRIGINATFPYITSILIDKDNNIWISMTNTTITSGEVFKSTNSGTTFNSTGPSIAGTWLYQDIDNNVWITTANGLYIMNKWNFTATKYLDGQNIYSFSQDTKGNAWVATTTNLFKTNSESYLKTGYTTLGSVKNTQYEGKEYLLANRDVNFYANDSEVTTVTVNGATTNINGKGFTKNLAESENGGKFNITVNYINGTIANFNFIVTSDNKNMAEFSTGATNKIQNYQAKLNDGLVNYIFVQSGSDSDPANLQITLGSQGYNPIIDTANSYYEQVNPFTFVPDTTTKTNLTASTNINKNGLYLIILTDLWGHTNLYYAQLGLKNDVPFLQPANPLIPLSSSFGISNNNLLIILSSAFAGLILILLIAWALCRHRKEIKTKIESTKKTSK